MATPSGYAFFLNEEVNNHMKKVLDNWRDKFLTQDASAAVLAEEPNGWLSPATRKVIEDDINMDPNHTAEDGPHWDFTSWNDFFTCTFMDYDKLRPVYAPDDDNWAVSACESKPFALQTNVKDYDIFWLKGQQHSVCEMQDKEEQASDFVHGTGLLERNFMSPLAFACQGDRQED
ncbi:Phophatidylserine decarboxylase-domain-containing protein [Aspergillus alliaceus]|uniref:Phophatidylserine decarboxylase-domain-containing protein n=1 Tax=Petromyces alliaceus TaxID=209559 RepID=A0A5N7CQD3_PETAA|nr:Phophatidylserine decarboxylase-domain-containing protein [Aspergillus alliaceus]